MEKKAILESRQLDSQKLLDTRPDPRGTKIRAPLNELANFVDDRSRGPSRLQRFLGVREYSVVSTGIGCDGPLVSRGEQARGCLESKQGEQQEYCDQREARRPRQTPDLVAVRQLDFDLGHLEDGQ